MINLVESGKQMSHGSDGAVDAQGNPLPVLSKSASKMKIDRLLNTPLPTFSGNSPGSPFWTWAANKLLKSTLKYQFRTFETTGTEKIPEVGGTLCCAWHTNGLIDPTSIMTSHPKNFVLGGRHDLVTRPILGFWARKLAVQPVVRQAELIRGGCSEEVAATINGRSLLNLSTGIAHGFGCFLFPEGTSHDESHLLRLKTGPMRTALSAAALAKGTGKPIPWIIPIGLHWRVRHHWRTDAWVEYSEPIKLDADKLSQEMADKLANGEWVEPPADIVHSLRDELRERLEYLTPNAKDWETYRAWHLLGHLENTSSGKSPKTWTEEVLAARAIRERLSIEPNEKRLKDAKKAANILENHALDGRDITSAGTLKQNNIGSKISHKVKIALGLLMLPIFLISCGLQAVLGKYLGDKNIDNEGLDARTSFQFLASMFGSLFFWPPIALIVSFISVMQLDLLAALPTEVSSLSIFSNEYVSTLVIAILLLPLFAISALIVVMGWDSLEDEKRSRRRNKLRKSDEGHKLVSMCKELIESSPK